MCVVSMVMDHYDDKWNQPKQIRELLEELGKEIDFL